MTLWQPGMRITSNRLNDGPPVISTNSGLVAASGFSVNDFRGYRSGRNIMLDLYLLRTGGTLTATTGNINDTQIATVPSGWRPTNGTINGDWDDGTANGGFVIGTDGVCTLRTASSDIVLNRNLRLHVGFILDN